MPYHPVFNVRAVRARQPDKFFLVVEATDPKFDRRQTRDFLKGLNAERGERS